MAGLMLKRSFSISTVAQQLVKIPIQFHPISIIANNFQVHGIEGRYASALYSAAYKQKKLDAVDKDFKSIREVYKMNPKFREFVKDPTLKPSNKKSVMEAYAKKLGVSKEVENFLGMSKNDSIVCIR
ncbi:unnamed protein product [Anisakis simplex]|uniref:Oligomycin sensitivity conferral protein n=1 Tax=Anisakis simplex TaxID=6269 RepID=A0A0M3J315_ANISI|nr:unnamed protein product [Anisakis simplex]